MDPAFLPTDRFRLGKAAQGGLKAGHLDQPPDTRALPPIERGPPVPAGVRRSSGRMVPPEGDDGFLEAGEPGGDGGPVYRTSFKAGGTHVHESKSVSELFRGGHSHGHGHAQVQGPSQARVSSRGLDVKGGQQKGSAGASRGSDGEGEEGGTASPPHPAASDMHHAASAGTLMPKMHGKGTGAATGVGSRVPFLAGHEEQGQGQEQGQGSSASAAADPSHSESRPPPHPPQPPGSPAGMARSRSRSHASQHELMQDAASAAAVAAANSVHTGADFGAAHSQASGDTSSQPGGQGGRQVGAAGDEGEGEDTPGFGSESHSSSYAPTMELAQEIIDRIGQPDSAVVTASLPAPIGEALP